jgi:uncharacterized protein (TIGR03435 family)
MFRRIAIAAFAVLSPALYAQTPVAQAPVAPIPAPRPAFNAFDVATIKPIDPDAKAGRYIIMQGTHRFIGKAYTLKLLIAAAYSLSPETISGGPSWIESDHFDITAITPGEVQPNHDEQMSMLRNLLGDRFRLTFHREPRQFSLYELQIANPKSASKLKPSTALAGDPPALISTVYPQRIVMPARNVTMADFVSVLQRAVLDRPVVDKTGLTGRYDFDLEWAPDDSQFGGDVKPASADAPSPPFFTAVQQELGLRLVAAKGPVEALVVDHAEHPTAN